METLLVLGAIGLVLLLLLRRNRYRWEKPEYPDPAQERNDRK